MEELLEGARIQGWISWGASVLTSPARWVWNRYLSTSGRGTAEDIYVDVELLQVS